MKTVLVTGGNRGIGLSFVKYYAAQGCNVIATSRKPSPELSALKVKTVQVDLFSDESISQLPLELNDTKIDLLINNAGILFRENLADATRQGMLDQYNVNAIAPLLVTKSLLPLLNEKSKIVFITSSMGSIAENESGGYYGYRASKAALNMIVKSLSIDLKESKIPVLALHPGYIQTDMTNGRGDMGPDDAVERMAARIEELDMARSGEYRHRDGRLIPN